VVPWTARLRGRSSGIPVDVSETYAVRVQDGRIVRVDEYRTKEEAIEAVRSR
jgi:ketosteroid isomerase-like protein